MGAQLCLRRQVSVYQWVYSRLERWLSGLTSGPTWWVRELAPTGCSLTSTCVHWHLSTRAHTHTHTHTHTLIGKTIGKMHIPQSGSVLAPPLGFRWKGFCGCCKCLRWDIVVVKVMPRKEGDPVQDDCGRGETCGEQSMWGKKLESTCSLMDGFQECLGHYRGLGQWPLDLEEPETSACSGHANRREKHLGFYLHV
jgi:hypothetical protein